MTLPTEAQLLRILVGETDKYAHRSLYEVIVQEARKGGVAGATVVRGMMGFGKASHIHACKILRFSEDLSMIIEIVDTPERVAAFLPDLDAMIGKGWSRWRISALSHTARMRTQTRLAASRGSHTIRSAMTTRHCLIWHCH